MLVAGLDTCQALQTLGREQGAEAQIMLGDLADGDFAESLVDGTVQA